MKYRCGKVEDLNIAYIGGGSRGWAWTFMTDLALEPQLSGTIRLYDIDKAAAENNAIIGNRVSERPEAVGKWRYTVCETLETALTGVAGQMQNCCCDILRSIDGVNYNTSQQIQ